MSSASTVLLGAIAGVTIFLGLPVGRMRTSRAGTRTFLNGVSSGILVFLLLDIFMSSMSVLEKTIDAVRSGKGSWEQLAATLTVYLTGLALGLLGLHHATALWRKRKPPQAASLGPGAMAVPESHLRHQEALRIGMSIAAGIGLHNFSEGLAIGQAAHTGEVSLALLLVIGFALHNATEGFGIVGPVAAAGQRAPWRWLLVAGIVGGGPTFLGTIVGSSVGSRLVFVGFLTLAAGAILYVLGELFASGRKLSWTTTLWGMLAGFSMGLLTDLVLKLAGA